MHPDETALLVSSPNTGGGLFLYVDGHWTRLNHKPATGLAISNGGIYVGFQQGLSTGEHTLACLREDDPREVSSQLLGDIHDVAILANGIYVVGTWDNAILRYDLVTCALLDRWQFTDVVDSWHVNSVTEWNGEVVFSAFGDFAEHRGYSHYAKGEGFVRELKSGTTIIHGIHKPHSLVTTPDGGLLLGNSGEGELRYYDRNASLRRTIQLGGFVRGIDHAGEYVYAGLSAKRGGSSTEAQMASVRVLATDSWEVVHTITCPFSEIYDIRSIHRPVALGLVATLYNAQIGVLSRRLAETNEASQADRERLDALVTALKVSQADRERLAARVTALETSQADRERLAARVHALETSTSWRLTGSIRAVARAWRALRQEPPRHFPATRRAQN